MTTDLIDPARTHGARHMSTDTMTPIIPTPDWKRAIRAEFWGAPERNPYLIPITEVADRIGIKRESMTTNATTRPMWFPFDVVTIGRAPDGGQLTRYYRRSEVEPWIKRYLRQPTSAERGAKVRWADRSSSAKRDAA